MRFAQTAILLACAGRLWVQGADPYAAVPAATEGSVERRRASVDVQLRATRRMEERMVTEPARGVEAAPVCERLPPDHMDRLIHRTSEREGLTPDLLRAIIRRESSFRPCAVPPKGAMGLMQLMPATAADPGVEEPFDARENVEGGARLLKQLLTRYAGDLALALGANNAGPARVDAAGGLPPIVETLDYVRDIRRELGITALESWDPP